jgi:hypothetical protein
MRPQHAHREVIARYDLNVELNSFDYYGWQAQVAAMGATEIVFDLPRGAVRVPEYDARFARFASIILPGPAMLGLPHRLGQDGPTLASSRFRHLCPWAKQHGANFPRLRSVLGRGPYQFTVTMRNQKTKPDRNSDQVVWRTFAEEIGAHVIEDFDDVPIHLHERMWLYAGARMNFGIVSGPLTMCSFSIYPCVTFGWEWAWGNGFYEKAGISYGEAMPWLGPNQFTEWEVPTLARLRRWFAEWSKANAVHPTAAVAGTAFMYGTRAR